MFVPNSQQSILVAGLFQAAPGDRVSELHSTLSTLSTLMNIYQCEASRDLKVIFGLGVIN